MASFRDPVKTFAPIQVVERLLEIADYYGHRPVLFITSSEDLASYLDSFGFDIYTPTGNPSAAFSHTSRIVTVLPNGSRSHESATAH